MLDKITDDKMQLDNVTIQIKSEDEFYFLENWKRYFDLDGWLDIYEAMTLFKIAYQSTGDIIEIGSWKGKSTLSMALGLKYKKSDNTIYAIDTFEGSAEHGHVDVFESFLNTLSEFNALHFITPIKSKSHDARDKIEECDVLFIDGDHDYNAVLQDYLDYEPKLKIGGTLVLHDVSTPIKKAWDGPSNLALQLLLSGKFKDYGYASNLLWMVKVK